MQICAYVFVVMQNLVKIAGTSTASLWYPSGWNEYSSDSDSDRIIYGRVIMYFLFSKWRLSAILDFHIFAIFFVKNSNLRLYLRRHAKVGKDPTICSRVIAHFWFSKWRPWIWHDPRLVFDGPNVLLKLQVDRINIMRDITIFTHTTRSTARYLLWKDGWLSHAGIVSKLLNLS